MGKDPNLVWVVAIVSCSESCAGESFLCELEALALVILGMVLLVVAFIAVDVRFGPMAKQRIQGPYSIRMASEGTFNLIRDGLESEPTFENVVGIAWTNGLIFVSNRAAPPHADRTNGWMILNSKDGSVTGPVSDLILESNYHGLRPIHPVQLYR